MNTPSIISNSATMSSLDIADLTGKNHADVLRDIRNVLNKAIEARKAAEILYCFHPNHGVKI